MKRRRTEMPNPRDTITNRLYRALLEIAESPVATAQEKLDAVDLFLKVKGLAKLRRNSATPGKQPKLAIPPFAVLGTK
jgi:hypothetical protein